MKGLFLAFPVVLYTFDRSRMSNLVFRQNTLHSLVIYTLVLKTQILLTLLVRIGRFPADHIRVFQGFRLASNCGDYLFISG